MMKTMSHRLVDKLRTRKRHFKQECKENGEKLRSELQTLETQLFSTKVETEILKNDKKYFED